MLGIPVPLEEGELRKRRRMLWCLEYFYQVSSHFYLLGRSAPMALTFRFLVEYLSQTKDNSIFEWILRSYLWMQAIPSLSKRLFNVIAFNFYWHDDQTRNNKKMILFLGLTVIHVMYFQQLSSTKLLSFCLLFLFKENTVKKIHPFLFDHNYKI